MARVARQLSAYLLFLISSATSVQAMQSQPCSALVVGKKVEVTDTLKGASDVRWIRTVHRNYGPEFLKQCCVKGVPLWAMGDGGYITATTFDKMKFFPQAQPVSMVDLAAQPGIEGQTILMRAIKAQHYSLLSWLFKFYVPDFLNRTTINLADVDGETFLHYLVRNVCRKGLEKEYLQIFMGALSADGDLSLEDSSGKTPEGLIFKECAHPLQEVLNKRPTTKVIPYVRAADVVDFALCTIS